MSNVKFTWGHGVILALVSFMSFILILIFLASDTGELVTEDYYEHSLTYQQEIIDAESNYNKLKEKPELIYQANGILIEFPESIKVDSGSVYFMRGAHKANDINLSLKLYKNGMLVPAAKLKEGEYDFNLTWFSNHKKYLFKKLIKWNMP